MKKQAAQKQKPANAVDGAERIGFTVNPTSVYNRREVANVLGVTITHLARLRRSKGLPIQTGGKGYMTGQELLDWIKGQNAAAN